MQVGISVCTEIWNSIVQLAHGSINGWRLKFRTIICIFHRESGTFIFLAHASTVITFWSSVSLFAKTVDITFCRSLIKYQPDYAWAEGTVITFSDKFTYQARLIRQYWPFYYYIWTYKLQKICIMVTFIGVFD